MLPVLATNKHLPFASLPGTLGLEQAVLSNVASSLQLKQRAHSAAPLTCSLWDDSPPFPRPETLLPAFAFAKRWASPPLDPPIFSRAAIAVWLQSAKSTAAVAFRNITIDDRMIGGQAPHCRGCSLDGVGPAAEFSRLSLASSRRRTLSVDTCLQGRSKGKRLLVDNSQDQGAEDRGALPLRNRPVKRDQPHPQRKGQGRTNRGAAGEEVWRSLPRLW